MSELFLRLFSTAQPYQFSPLHRDALLRVFSRQRRIRCGIAGDAAGEEFSGLTAFVVGTRPVEQAPIIENDEVADLPLVVVDPWGAAGRPGELV